MYLNVVKLQFGKTLRFKTFVACRSNNVEDGLNTFTDIDSGRIVTFRGLDVSSIECYPQKDKYIKVDRG